MPHAVCSSRLLASILGLAVPVSGCTTLHAVNGNAVPGADAPVGHRGGGAVVLATIATHLVAVVARFPRLFDTVAAARCDGRMQTALLRITGVRCALLGIVTVRRPGAGAGTISADVSDGALVGIVARVGVVRIDAADVGLTGIVGADVAVIAIHAPGTCAFSVCADIA